MNQAAEETRRQAREEVRKLPGFKTTEMQLCLTCGKSPIGKGLSFYRVRIERFMFNPEGMQQFVGTAMQLGGGAAGLKLAEIMGSNPDIAKRISETDTFLLCDDCVLNGREGGPGLAVLMLLERYQKREEKETKAMGGDDVDPDKEGG